MENIQKRVGHSNLTTTEQIYAHCDDSQKADNPKGQSRVSWAGSRSEAR